MVRTMGLNLGQRSETWPCFAEQRTWSNLVSEYKVGMKHWLLVVGVSLNDLRDWGSFGGERRVEEC